MRKLFIVTLLAFVGFNVSAQNLPERGVVRKGNRLFDKEKYEESVESYSKALTFSPNSFDINYNLSNAQHKLQQFDKAEESMAKLAVDSLRSAADRADAYYNLGNSQFHQQKLKEALESYKSSMRLNPTDTAAKYNYAITKLLLEAQPEQENQDQENQENQDQDNQDNQDQNQDQNQDNKDQEQNQGEDEQEQQQQPQEGGMSEQEQQQILDAIQAQEDKTQEKLDEQKGQAILVPGGKNW
ncbi:MAG: tetratricopeptide repeat protein [Rikenellaceae bacterium]